MKYTLAIFLISLSFTTAFSQEESSVLTYEDYLTNIIQFHPLAKKAELKLAFAKSELLGAKGNFDPTITSSLGQKKFDDKIYYRQYQTKLKFPTQLGIDVVAGYENTEGAYLNPESKTGDFGLWNLGLEVNLLQGLIVNERKIALKQAEIFQKLAKNEQQILLNDLVYNASSAYLIWQQYVSYKGILNENISLANSYFENTKLSYTNGEKTAMDTLEAFVSFQDAVSILQKNELGLTKSKQNLENYLWFKNAPITLQENTIPEENENQLFPEILNYNNADLTSHPVILAALNKLTYYEIEQRLKREKLKPKLKIKYNPLIATAPNSFTPTYSANDYKWGFDFAMPLLLRSERANLQKGRIKIQEIELDLQIKKNELQNKIENSWQQQQILQKQKDLLDRNVVSYSTLLAGENEKFKFGESSVFLLNKRQEKYINGRIKLVETNIKRQIELLNFLYYSNQLIKE